MLRRAFLIALHFVGIASGIDVDRPSSRLRGVPSVSLIDEYELVPLLLYNDTRLHFNDVQGRLVPILSALPAEQPGYVCQRVARYAIVRYFLVHRGWYMKGLSKDAGVWNEFPADVVSESRFVSMLLRFIVRTLYKALIDMKDLVRVVVAVETLVHSNTKDILMMAYDTLNLSVEEPLQGPDKEWLVMKTFCTFLVSPYSEKDITQQPVESFLQELRESRTDASFWVEYDMWVADISQTTKRALANPFSKSIEFAVMLGMAEVVSSDIVSLYHTDCLSMKHRLADAAGTSNGRIALADFYRPELEDDLWDFQESPKYLESLGALDLRTPRHDHVLIPNYVTAPSNCLESSTFHQVCCVNECEMLMMHVEAAVGKPDVGPGGLLEAVAVLSSDTVRAPRNLSESLQNRLVDISRMHDGTVPLHGRMFSEWMHRAFPNECPMPAGMRLRKVKIKEGERLATEQEKQDIIKSYSSNGTGQNTSDLASQEEDVSDGLQMPWSDTEELLTHQDWKDFQATGEEKVAAAGRPTTVLSYFLALVIAAVVASSFVYILAAQASSLPALLCSRPKKKAVWP